MVSDLKKIQPSADLRTMNARAFSLVEVVLAIGIFAFAALAIVALLGQGMKTSRDARLESVSALLSGKVNSTLRASSAWDNPTDDAKAFTQNRSLTDIADGSPASSTNYYSIALSATNATNPAQFAMVVRIEPFTANNFSSADTDVRNALASLPAAQNTVLLNVEVSFPALAPEANRSKRFFSSVITRTSTN